MRDSHRRGGAVAEERAQDRAGKEPAARKAQLSGCVLTHPAPGTPSCYETEPHL